MSKSDSNVFAGGQAQAYHVQHLETGFLFFVYD